MVSSDPSLKTLKLTDFGIAKLAEMTIDEAIEGGEDTTTASSTVVGALPYMAPEVFGDPKSANTAADIWSVGAMLYYLVSGEKPFGTGYKAIATILQGRLPNKEKFFKYQRLQFGTLLEELWGIIEMSLKADPAQRPTADQLIEMLSIICYSTAERKVGRIYNYGIRPGLMSLGFIESPHEDDCMFHKDSFFGGSPANDMKVNYAPFPGNPKGRAFPVLPLKGV